MRTEQARVEGPVTGGRHGWPFAASLLDLAARGVVEEEYILSGTARKYSPAGAYATRDGRWEAAPDALSDYRTRMVIHRPADPARFNGTVVLCWNNVTNGFDLFPSDSRELIEGGYALAALTTQKVGVDGMPPVRQGLRQWDPERYGDLRIESDDFSYDIFAQAARAVGPRRGGSPDPLAGLDVKRVIAWGASQSAMRLSTYINAIHTHTPEIDGFILAIHFARGHPLEVDDVPGNLAVPEAPPGGDILGDDLLERYRGRNLTRDDTGAKVFVVNSELEAWSCHGARQPDTDSFRYWELAGTCHVSRQGMAYRYALYERDGLQFARRPDNINTIPMGLAYDPVFRHMHLWLKDGTPPPKLPLLDIDGPTDGIGHRIRRDADGNATGGARLPQVAVPLAMNSAVPLEDGRVAYLSGSSRAFTRAEAERRHGDEESFLARFRAAAEDSAAQGFLLAEDIPRLLDEARAEWRSLA